MEKTGETTWLLPPNDNEIKKESHFTFHYRLPIRGPKQAIISKRGLNVFLTVMTVITNVAMNVSLPLYSESMDKTNTNGTNRVDEYPVLFLSSFWFPFVFFSIVFLNSWCQGCSSMRSSVPQRTMILCGALNSVNGLLVVYASDPTRTAPELQAVLSTSIIPFTVVCRYLILRKGVGKGRLVCTVVVLIGLFISLEPVIFDVDQSTSSSSDSLSESSSSGTRVMWPFLFALGFLPLGIFNVVIEKELKKDDTESFIFLAWIQLYNFIFILLLFWTDFIPGFGAASNPSEFWDHFVYGTKCMYGQDPECHSATYLSLLFIVSYCLANLFIILLVRFAEGAIYLVIVQSLVTPCGAIFWTFFKPEPSFHWHPVFNLATGFTLLGLVIMVPAVVMYNYLGKKDDDDVTSTAVNEVNVDRADISSRSYLDGL
ncbi:crt homolog 3-like [Antedon mediterranea]|uniref:crt homolog 3-like n=1 Tax=Antedon mediterranea TaxID=105859 RepID=UPI003AF706A7